jgi:hypothetical protein
MAYFVKKLKEMPDGDGTLLDHSLILWTLNMGNGNQHSHVDVPHMLIGGASGQHKGGNHVRTSGPTSNILLTTLNMFDIPKENIGDSTGAVSV